MLSLSATVGPSTRSGMRQTSQALMYRGTSATGRHPRTNTLGRAASASRGRRSAPSSSGPTNTSDHGGCASAKRSSSAKSMVGWIAPTYPRMGRGTDRMSAGTSPAARAAWNRS